MSSLPLTQQSKLAGFHEDKLSQIKHNSKELWQYLTDKRKELFVAYTEYLNESIEARDAVIEIYYKLQSSRNISAFAKFAFKQEESKKDFYKSEDSLKTAFQKIFTATIEQTPYKTFLKHKKIVAIFEKYEKAIS